MAVKVGPVSAKFSGKILLQDVQPPSSYTLRLRRAGRRRRVRQGHRASAPGAARCRAASLQYTVQAQVGGKIAQVGQRLIDGVARSMAEDFFKRFDAEMQRRHPAPIAAEPAPAVVAAAPSEQHALAAGGGGLPAWMWAVGVVVAAAVAWWFLR